MSEGLIPLENKAQGQWARFIGITGDNGSLPSSTETVSLNQFNRQAMLDLLARRLELTLHAMIRFADVQEPSDINLKQVYPPILKKLRLLFCGSIEPTLCSKDPFSERTKTLFCDFDKSDCQKQIVSTLYTYLVFSLVAYASLNYRQNTKLIVEALKALGNLRYRWAGPEESWKLDQLPFMLDPYPRKKEAA